MKRILAFSFLSAICLLSAYAQMQTELKLSPNLRMLISGVPSQEEEARKVLPIKAGPHRLLPAVGVFVKFQGDADSLRATFAAYGASIHTVVGNLATAEIPIPALRAIASLPNVIRIEESKPLQHTTDVSVPATGANQIWYGGGVAVPYTKATRGAMPPPWTGNTGQNAIVGVVDSGIDLKHKDFLDSTGATRILSLWDSTATKGTPPASPPGFSAFAGNECTSQQINAVHVKTDLVIAESFDEMMGVLLGAGTGFGAPNTFSKGQTSVAVAAADFDRDGNMDLVSGNLTGTISWVQGNGHGGFVPQAPIAVGNNNQVQITTVATADFNQDGLPDVVALLNTTNQAAILLGNGDGTFQPATFLSTGNSPTAAAVADLNGDGIPDFVVANYNDGTISVFLGIGDGTFRPMGPFPVSTLSPPNLSTGVGTFPSYIAVGDFNGDGKPDLAIADWGRGPTAVTIGSNLSIMLGNGDGTFGTPTSINTTHFETSIAVGDFNGDGKLDIALQSYPVYVTILLGNGDGTFGTPVDYNAGGGAGYYSGQAALVVGDFNGDGKPDIANLVRSNAASASDHFYDGVGLLLGNGDGTFGTATVYPTGSAGNATYLVAGDFHESVCTEVDLNGHGTLVAGIAAGNGSAGGSGPQQTPYRYIGMAPEAPMIVVKTMVDNTDVVDGVAYIANKAATLGKPVAIDLSLGNPYGPHDGTSIFDTMLSGLTGPGTIVIASTGNNANIGLHADGTLANGGIATLQLSVPPGISNLVELQLWYPGQDQFGVNITDPNGNQCMTSAVYPGDGIQLSFQNPICGTGTMFAGPADPDNGDHEVDTYLSNGGNPLTPGTWTMTLSGSGCGTDVCVTNGSFDLYTNRWCASQSSCTALTGSNVDPLKSLTEPATATALIAVGSYVTKTSWIGWGTDFLTPTQSTSGGTLGNASLFSGLGPRRTCSAPVCAEPVQKPDVVAPGDSIFAAYAAYTPTNVCELSGGACLDPDAQHIGAAGTSEAAPHVTGAVALLLSKYGKLSPCQVKQSLAQARTDADTGTVPNPTYGLGKLAVDLAIAQPPVQNVVVPSVVGQTLPLAEVALFTGSLFVGGVTYAGSGTVPVGSVISQNPVSGTSWCGGVDLVLSGIPVPDVAGMTMAQASAAITAVNLATGQFTLTPSLTVPGGDAIQTSPPAGTYVAPQSTVNVFISGIKVPDVTAISKSVALAGISAAGLPVGSVTFAASQTVPAGIVISQDPTAGTLVLPQTPVNLVVSGIPVPNVVGLAMAGGQTVITGANLTVGSLLPVSGGNTPVGNIISESPVAGTYVDVGSPVTLVVSGATIPNEVGQDQSVASAAIVAASLTVGNVSQAVSPVVPAGQVMNQNPGGGSVVLPGTTVDLVVSSGAVGQITVPNVVGSSQANATAAIGNAGLVVGTVTTANSATVAASLVISESPVAGSPASLGSPVNIVVSLGPLAQLQSIAVTPANPSIAAGLSLQFTTTGNYTGNSTQNLTNQVTWAATGAATITAGGLATTHAIGAGTISATFGAMNGSTLLTAADPGKCDTNHDGLQTMGDIQSSINQALGVSPPGADLIGDGVINVADVQVVLNATLGKGCPAP